MAPERPAALPRLELRKAFRDLANRHGNGFAWAIRKHLTGDVTQSCRWSRSGSVSACNVVASPGARAAAVNTWHARESSPRLTSVHARAPRASLVSPSRSGCGRPCRSAARRLSLCSSAQLPRQKNSSRCNSSARPCAPMASRRVRRSRGSSRNNFHTRKQPGGLRTSAMAVRAARNARLTRGVRKRGTDCSVGSRTWNS